MDSNKSGPVRCNFTNISNQLSILLTPLLDVLSNISSSNITSLGHQFGFVSPNEFGISDLFSSHLRMNNKNRFNSSWKLHDDLRYDIS